MIINKFTDFSHGVPLQWFQLVFFTCGSHTTWWNAYISSSLFRRCWGWDTERVSCLGDHLKKKKLNKKIPSGQRCVPVPGYWGTPAASSSSCRWPRPGEGQAPCAGSWRRRPQCTAGRASAFLEDGILYVVCDTAPGWATTLTPSSGMVLGLPRATGKRKG